MINTYLINIYGRVQGVGFRPWVYRIATEFGLSGTVSNNESGVIIYINASESDAEKFYNSLIADPPPLSKIDGHLIELTESRQFDGFQIVPSTIGANLNLQLTPDFAICSDCQTELFDKDNRRYLYPFITCVNCGPRWTITNAFPFEREHTSIDNFSMCENCLEEYGSPVDRRFHSQTNSCEQCGISYALNDSSGNVIQKDDPEIFRQISALIEEGKIIAIRNNTGYLLCCDATNADTIQKLRSRKRRPRKPFAVMYPTMEMLSEDFEPTKRELDWLTSVERPIVILNASEKGNRLASDAIAPGLKQMGIMLPYSGVLAMLADKLSFPIVATSGNMHGSPIIANRIEAEDKLSEVADYFFHHNLEILNSQDDSVIRISPEFQQPILFRRSRGMAPNYPGRVDSKSSCPISLGAQMKSAIGFIPNDYLYLSQYLGSLDKYEVYQRFEETVQKFIEIFQQSPDLILADAHRGYLCTAYGESLSAELKVPINYIQHHKAHFAAILGEHSLFDSPEPLLGVVWDGTGLGDDANIWGGEFFTYFDNSMDRHSHFEYFDWLAGDKMAKEPRLSLLSISEAGLTEVLAEKFSEEELGVYRKLLEHNSLKTSSVGRLFDAVSSLLGICDYNSFEGEAPMLLETYARDLQTEEYKAYIAVESGNKISTKDLINAIHTDLVNGVDRRQITLNFLYTLVRLIFDTADFMGIKAICLSGGVFQNATLVDMILKYSDEKYKLYFHSELSPNDENIAYGQLMYYLNCSDSQDR